MRIGIVKLSAIVKAGRMDPEFFIGSDKASPKELAEQEKLKRQRAVVRKTVRRIKKIKDKHAPALALRRRLKRQGKIRMLRVSDRKKKSRAGHAGARPKNKPASKRVHRTR